MKQSIEGRTEQAVDSLVGFDPLTNKNHCKVCGNLYVHQGTTCNHVKKEHLEHVERKTKEIEDQAKLTKTIYYHKALFTETDRAIKNVEKAIAEAKKMLNENFEYNFSWVTEELLKKLETRQLLELVKRTIEHFDNLEDIAQELEELKSGWTNDVLSNFPRHSSTSELTNVQERLKAEAKAEFVSGRFGGGHLREMIRLANRLIKLQEEL